MKTKLISARVVVLALFGLPSTVSASEPMSTAFTYRGQLKESGVPVNGLADFEFTLWDAGTNGNPVGGAIRIYE